MKVGDKAMAKHGYHRFEIDSVISFLGMDYGQDEMIYMFRGMVDGKEIAQDLIDIEFIWEDEVNV